MTTTTIKFETETCARCAGSGEYPSSAWQGACLGCRRKGVVLTRAGKAAVKAYETWLAENMVRPVTEIKVGQAIRSGSRWHRVTGVEHHGNEIYIVTPKITTIFGEGTTVTLRPEGDDFTALAKRMGRLKGATVVTT